VIEGAAEIIKPNLASEKPLLLKEREAVCRSSICLTNLSVLQ
jgi:hypothetical protein